MNRVFRSPRARPKSSRAGIAYRAIVVVLLAVAAVPLIAWFVLPRFSWSSPESAPILHRVERGTFVHEITERGNIESASNVEVRCEVKAKGSGGTTILEIVPEGTYVEKDDLLVRLDSSALEDNRTQQQIVCSNSEAAVIQAKNQYDSAVIAKQEYLEGQFRQEIQNIQSEIFVAEEDLRRAQEYLGYSERLAAKGYVTALQLEADRFAVDKAENELDKAKTKLEVLQKYTKQKKLIDLEADIKTAKARLLAEERSHELDLEKLELIESQIEKCAIHAPEAGQVVYANETNRRGGNEVIIEEGTTVREQQVIIRLPDPKRMQVEAKINESKVSLVEEEMPARIRLDAFPDLELPGTVTKVNEYPAPTSWFNSNVKEYETKIAINEANSKLRPGLTAEVKIFVERLDDVIQVPVQAVFEHGGLHYAAVAEDGKPPVAQQVTIGSTNDSFVVIEEGLTEGQHVVLGAVAMRDELNLPEIAENDPQTPALPDAQPGDRAAQSNQPASGPGPGRSSGQTGGAATGPSKSQAAANPGGGKPDASEIVGRMFSRMDANGNGQLEIDEIPERARSRLKPADADGDGSISRAELTAAMKKMAAQGGGSRPGGRQ
jgi:multidrug efflux pump subunit AcrA (membrane-fusion protein)